MAANNDPELKRAARMADAWFINPHATSDTIRRQMAVYRAELEAAGKGAPRELPVVKEGDRTRNGWTLPAGEIPGLCQVGAGQSHARRYRLQSPARRINQAAVHPWLARGLLRPGKAILGRVWRQSHRHPHALGGDAIIHLTREHA